MLKKLKHKLTGTEEKKRLAGNIFSLGVLQGANYILPLLTLPYLVRVLGPEYFGLLAFATATIMYFMLITDYGFNLSATRQISIHRDDKDKVNEIFSSVMMIKTALMVVSFGLMSLLVFSFEKFSQHWEVYFVTFGMVIGQVLFPVWLFQGMERMKYITYLNIGAKVFFTVCIFMFVKEQADYLLVPLLTAMGFIVAGIWSLYLVKKEFNVRFAWQTAATLKFQLAEGWHIFNSSIAINSYKNNSILILGFFVNPVLLGYFAMVKKVFEAINGLNVVISQAFFPLVAKNTSDSDGAITPSIRLLFIVIATFALFSSFLLFFSSSVISIILMGEDISEITNMLKLLAFVLLVIGINVPAVHYLLSMNEGSFFSRSVWFGAILDLTLIFLLVEDYGVYGAIYAMMISELTVTILLYYFSYKVFRYGRF